MVNEVKEERQGQDLIAGVNETSLHRKGERIDGYKKRKMFL